MHIEREVRKAIYDNISIIGVMKMGNTVPRAGFKAPFLTFQVNVLPLHHFTT